MHVFEKAGKLASGWISEKKEQVFGKASFVVQLCNGTFSELKVTDKQVASGDCSVPFGSLRPGEAGALRFAGDSGFEAKVVFSAGGSEHVTLRFATSGIVSGAKSEVTAGAGHSVVIAWGDTAGFDRPTGDLSCGKATVLVTTKEELPSSGGSAPTLGKHFSLGDLSSWQLAWLAESILSSSPALLGCAVFIGEYAALLGALPQFGRRDEAFAVDLLIDAFVSSDALGEAGSKVLAPNLERWRSHRPPLLAAQWPSEYAAYSQLPEDNLAQLQQYVDAGHSVLKAASLFAARALKEFVAKRADAASGTTEVAHMASTDSVVDTENLADNSAIFTQHLQWQEQEAASVEKQAAAGAKKDDTDIPSLVKYCIAQTASYMLRSGAVFAGLKGLMVGPEGHEALQRYCDWLPGVRRDFSRHAGAGGGAVRINAYGAELFANLDGGQVASPGRLLKSLGPDSLDLKSMSTNSKSGEFFFFSGDRRFLIKTVSDAEGLLLHKMLPAYQNHLRQLPRSFIVRYAGLYHVQVEGGISKFFTIMASVFDACLKVHETYDVKGSLFHRKAKAGESIGKDSDWFESGRRLKLTRPMRRELLAIHEQDCQFLASFNVMDYSVLIGVHKLPDDAPAGGSGFRRGGGLWAEGAREVYFAGVIDFLIGYGLYKEAEHVVRAAQGHAGDASCVHPEDYSRRQVAFVRDKVFDAPDDTVGTLGTLRVSGMQGINLINADSVLDASDPYVKVSLGLQCARTTTIKNNLNPVWKDEELVIPVNEHHRSMNLTLALWDEEGSAALRGSDDFLGHVVLPMSRLVNAQKVELKEALKGVAHGEVVATLAFTPAGA
mmetsp:Transcript_6934/g.19551  ORF Transcript_6934/g.19551 Transcript_6934/m.19551 type:complete len:833 (-) Transcript_6934:32-2530(-)